MSSNSRGLGKGLNALFNQSKSGESADKDGELVVNVAISEIVANRNQPRIDFDDEALEELSQSIKQYGVLQPVLLRHTINGYELIAGERRLRASKLAGLKTVPAIVRALTDSQTTEIALIENLQREDLTAIEEALAYNRLLTEFGLTQDELSKKIGKSRSHIANFIRLLNLPDVIQDYIAKGTISMGQAKPLLSLDNDELRLQAAEYIIAEDLSARASEELVKKLANKKMTPKDLWEQVTVDQREIFVVDAEEKLKILLGTQVKIKPGKVKSKIEIDFYTSEDLERIVEVLTSDNNHKPNAARVPQFLNV